MKTEAETRTLWIYPVAFLSLITGCTPGPPLPPGLGFGPAGGIWIFFVVLIALVAWSVVKATGSGSSGQDKEITKSLHRIHERLEELERQIRHIKNSTQGGNHE